MVVKRGFSVFWWCLYSVSVSQNALKTLFNLFIETRNDCLIVSWLRRHSAQSIRCPFSTAGLRSRR